MKQRYKRKKGSAIVKTASKGYPYKGVNYKSQLERFMAICLTEAGIRFEYEPKAYTLFPGFRFTGPSYERYANGKPPFEDRGNKKVLPITYKPDFVGEGFVIETKGFANEAFRNRWKMFKKWIQENEPGTVLFKPQNQKECRQVIDILKNENRGAKKGKR